MYFKINSLYLIVGLFVFINVCEVSLSEKQRVERCLGLHNGCTSPKFYESYNTLFTPACNEHDACYFCGHYHNITREKCDDYFYEDMLEICKNEWYEWTCRFNAFIFYSATRTFGMSYYYSDLIFPICKKECVKDVLFRAHPH